MRWGRLVMGVLYFGAGVTHFVVMRAYAAIVPGYLPAHHALVVVSGVAEMAGGLGALVGPWFPRVGRAAAWGIVVLLVAVWPANLWMVQHPELFPRVPLWVAWVRLPLQVPLIWWAWRYAVLRGQRETLRVGD